MLPKKHEQNTFQNKSNKSAYRYRRSNLKFTLTPNHLNLNHLNHMQDIQLLASSRTTPVDSGETAVEKAHSSDTMNAEYTHEASQHIKSYSFIFHKADKQNNKHPRCCEAPQGREPRAKPKVRAQQRD